MSSMADFAIWVDDKMVDSAVLLSGFLQMKSQFPRAVESLGLTNLHLKTHKAPPMLVPPFEGVAQKPCEESSCRRCDLMLGGYAWRWLHQLWLDPYEANKREGALSLRKLAPGVASGAYRVLYLCKEMNQDLPLVEPTVPRSLSGMAQVELDYVTLSPGGFAASIQVAESSGDDETGTDQWAHDLLRRLQAQRGLQTNEDAED